MITDLHKHKIEWDLLGYGQDIIENYKGLTIKIENSNGDINLVLYLDGFEIMSTRKYEHNMAVKCVNDCPENARVFIGGLGLGLVPLYLAESNKTKEVLIVERDNRVLDIIAPKIEKYLAGHYPQFNYKIIEGDAYDEILTNGLFDWIFIDISDGTPSEFFDLSNYALTKNGVFTPVERINDV